MKYLHVYQQKHTTKLNDLIYARVKLICEKIIKGLENLEIRGQVETTKTTN